MDCVIDCASLYISLSTCNFVNFNLFTVYHAYLSYLHKPLALTRVSFLIKLQASSLIFSSTIYHTNHGTTDITVLITPDWEMQFIFHKYITSFSLVLLIWSVRKEVLQRILESEFINCLKPHIEKKLFYLILVRKVTTMTFSFGSFIKNAFFLK